MNHHYLVCSWRMYVYKPYIYNIFPVEERKDVRLEMKHVLFFNRNLNHKF